jgi:hypothetical protein
MFLFCPPANDLALRLGRGQAFLVASHHLMGLERRLLSCHHSGKFWFILLSRVAKI